MFAASSPRFIHMLKNLDGLLNKAQEYSDAKKLGAEILPSSRLYPDMFALARQVQIASDISKGAVARLAGVDIPVFEDNEKTLAELKARIAKTITFIESVPAAKIDGTEDKDIEFKSGGHEMAFKGQNFLLGFALPNFYFHVVTVYNILRHCGVEVGKRDFVGAVD